MNKKPEAKRSMVFRTARLHSEIDSALNDEVNRKIHPSYNGAVNHHLQKSLKVKIAKQLTLTSLSVGDKFIFATNRGYIIYKVIEECKRRKRKGMARPCEVIETGNIVYHRCDKEVIKIE